MNNTRSSGSVLQNIDEGLTVEFIKKEAEAIALSVKSISTAHNIDPEVFILMVAADISGNRSQALENGAVKGVDALFLGHVTTVLYRKVSGIFHIVFSGMKKKYPRFSDTCLRPQIISPVKALWKSQRNYCIKISKLLKNRKGWLERMIVAPFRLGGHIFHPPIRSHMADRIHPFG
jgi:hypothetical protein